MLDHEIQGVSRHQLVFVLNADNETVDHETVSNRLQDVVVVVVAIDAVCWRVWCVDE